jgi:3-deoxy-D-manno-octulosonic-acid transferase
MRLIYSILFYLALPLICLRLLWRSRKLPDYRKRISERFGFYPFELKQCLWVHSVSVGETIAATPLIRSLMQHYPSIPVLVTTMTPTGSARVKAAFADRVYHVYLPYDLPFAVNRFLNAMNPIVAIIMETELWPNLIAACDKRHIPIALMNARLSEKSARGYQRIASLTKTMLQSLAVIAAHGAPDANRFIELGAVKDRVYVTGNIKFDLDLPADLVGKGLELRDGLGADRFIWIAASTHEGEEEIILKAHQKLRAVNEHALLILVPRHPDRFELVGALCEKYFQTEKRSQVTSVKKETAVYLGDTMGELLLMYAASDAALVCGSLIERGGHNILEPAALAKAILSGPHTFNFAEISLLFKSENALVTVTDAETLAKQLIHLYQHPDERSALGQRAYQVLAANRGALEKQVTLLHEAIKSVQ